MKENHYLKIASNEVAEIEDLKDYRKDLFNTVLDTIKFVRYSLFSLMIGLLYALLQAIQTQNNLAILITALLLVFISLVFLWLIKNAFAPFLPAIENEYLLYLEAKKLITEKKKLDSKR